MGNKLTNEIVDQRLLYTNIIRCGEYTNSKSLTLFQCTISNCLYKWETVPSSLFRGVGCPDCYGNAPLTNERVDRRLIPLLIERVDNIINATKLIKFRCVIDGFVWKAAPYSVLYGQSGCKQCSNSIRITNQIFDEKLLNRNITRLGDILNNHKPIWFLCGQKECCNEWRAAPKSIYLLRSGCPECANKNKGSSQLLSNEIVDYRLIGRNIIRLDNYINCPTPIHFQCTLQICKNIWSAAPNNILNSEQGCPDCCAGKNEKLVKSILLKNSIFFEYQKYLNKISTEEKNRFKVDFYFPEIRTILEYDGKQHSEPTQFGGISMERALVNFAKQIKRDEYVNNFCSDNNITLIRIDGRQYANSKLEKYMINYIVPKINHKSNLVE